MPLISEECLVVGAGPTGLALAIELRRFGLPVRLIDKSDHPAQWSQALVVQARTLEQFERYGISDEAVAQGRKINQARLWSDGKQIAAIDLQRIASRFAYVLMLPQNETEQLLTQHLQSLGVEVERQTELTSFENAEDGRSVSANLRHSDGREEQGRFRWLVGCDGAHSTVRRGTGASFEGDTVGLYFSLGDLALKGEDVPGDELQIHLHRGGDVLFIGKLKEGLHRVILALHEQQSEDRQRMPELTDFNGAFERYGLKMTAESASWLAPFHVNQRKAGRYRQGSVFVAGDASHIHSPVGGQGMNTGIQDAANLAWKLAAVQQGADERLLDSYDEERGQVGEALLRGTSRGLRMATASNFMLEMLRDFVLKGASRLEAVQDAIAGAISETAIAYRTSSVVSDEIQGGPLRAGDRMPDAEREGTGETLLSALRQPRHLLIAVDTPLQDVLRNFKQTAVLDVESSQAGWTPPLQGLLGKGPQVLMVRPDGYLGFRGAADGDALVKYARNVGLL